MNRNKVIIGVLMATIFVMMAFFPLASNISTDKGNASANSISPQTKINSVSNLKGQPVNRNAFNDSTRMNHVEFNQNLSSFFGHTNLKWQKVSIPSKYTIKAKSVLAEFANGKNNSYTYVLEKGIQVSRYQAWKTEVITGHGFRDTISTTNNSITIYTAMHENKNSKDRTNINSHFLIKNGNRSNLVNVDPKTYHQSFSWGQAWVFYGSTTFYGGIGLRDYGIMLGIITLVSTTATGALLWSNPFVAAAAVILEAVTVAGWAVFGNEHTTTCGSQIPYVEIDISEGKWWDPWDTGAYGELGAHSNQITPFNGGAPTYTGWKYFPFLTTVNPSDTLPYIQSYIPHSNVWPSLTPPW